MAEKSICDVCGHNDTPKSYLEKGSPILEIVVWIIFIFVFFPICIAYSIYRGLSRVYLCRSCDAEIYPIPESNLKFAGKFCLHIAALPIIYALFPGPPANASDGFGAPGYAYIFLVLVISLILIVPYLVWLCRYPKYLLAWIVVLVIVALVLIGKIDGFVQERSLEGLKDEIDPFSDGQVIPSSEGCRRLLSMGEETVWANDDLVRQYESMLNTCRQHNKIR